MNLWKILPIVIFLTIGLVVYGLHTKTNNTAVSSAQETLPVEMRSSEATMRLKIPSINVDAAVEHVGLTPQGAMGAPKGPADTAWFDLGPSPGEIGTAVIDGHSGWGKGMPAVFDTLYTLQKGDRVYVQDTNGTTITFIVRELRVYGEGEDSTGVFVSNDGKAHLNLITCEGVWNTLTKRYSNRLVVFTDIETE